MNGESPGYDFIYDPEVRAMLPSLAEDLKRELREIEHELLRDQSPENPRIRYRYGITMIGVVSTEHIDAYFLRASALVARVVEIQIRL